MQEIMVPLITSGIAGPLGVLHLPRLWYKVLLRSVGKLPEGYRCGKGGFDERLLTDLGIDHDAFIAYIEGSRPEYLALEDWVRANATNLNAESIAAFNTYVVEREMPADMLAQRRAELNLTDMSLTKGVMVNNIDDWSLAHRQITSTLG
jgi:hypothetical protein